MTYRLNLKTLDKKETFLGEMSKIFPDMFSLNYDAFIDSATFFLSPVVFEIKNIECFEDKQNLLEILDIIRQENPNFSYTLEA